MRITRHRNLSVPGLQASQMVIYVEGADSACRHNDRDDDDDNNRPASVYIGQQNVVWAHPVPEHDAHLMDATVLDEWNRRRVDRRAVQRACFREL